MNKPKSRGQYRLIQTHTREYTSLQGPKTHYSKFKIFVPFLVSNSHLVRREGKQHRERKKNINIPRSEFELKEKKLKSVETKGDDA